MKKGSDIGDKGPSPAAAAAAKGARDSGKIKFVGDGSEYIDGVPPHDLDAAEYMALSEGEREAVKASPLYEFDAYERLERPGEADEAPAEIDEAAA